MKKIKYALFVAMIACLTFGVCSCVVPDSSGSLISVSTTINGFDVEESIVINEREMVDVVVPIVTDGNGNVLDVVYEVTTADGGYVGTSAGKFFASDTQGYVIRYVVIGKDSSTHEKTTTVVVKSNEQLDLSAEYDVFVESGVETNIIPVCSLENPIYTYTVTEKSTGENIAVAADGAYVCNATGWYTVEIKVNASGKEASYSYEVYCREAMQEGEVEIFGSDWETIRLLQNYGTYNAKYTNTEESGVKDRFGLDSEFLVLKSSDFIEYANLYINPRGDEAYYRQLAEEGYTHISFWIYSECTIPHDIMLQLFPTKGLYTFDIGSVMPNKWVEMKLNIVESKAYYESCFAAAVDYFKNQETPILQFDNTNGWNGPNGSYGYESDMTFYISDVYAVKPSGIEVNSDAKTAYQAGETVVLSDLFEIPEGMQVQYAVTYNGETVPVSEEYTFLANGTYEVSVISAANLSCDETVKLTVVDGVSVSVVSVQKERVGDSTTIDLSELDVQFTLDGTTLTPTNYKVTLDGEEIPVSGNAFTAEKDGSYIVEYEIPYQVDDVDYVSYVEVKIDVWSESSKYIVSDNMHMFASSEYCGASNWDKQPTYEAGIYTVGDKTGNMLKISSIGEALLVPFKPVYTKAYYESILAAMPEAKVLVQYYVTPQESGISARCYASDYTGGALAYDKWNTSAISLADFIEDYDMLSEGYNEVKYLMDNDIVQTHSRNENDYLLWMTGARHLDKVTIYVAEIYIVEKVEVENDGVWNDLQNADALSTTINPWVEVQATRNGLVGAEEVALIGGQENALYTKVTANNGWFCYAGYQIKPSLTIKDAWLSYIEKDLVFDWYYDITGDTENTYNYNVSVYGGANKAYAQDTWHTSRISMEDILADWDDVVIGSNNMGGNSPWTPWIRFRYTTAAHAEQAGVVYLGNIRFEEHVEDGGDGEGGESEETPKFWNDLSSTDAIKTTANRWYHTIPALPTESELAEIGAMDGATYLRMDGNSGFFMYAGYKILPSGEKADYEQYAGLTLVFDWYYSIPSIDGAKYAVSVYGADDAQFAEGTWHTVTIAIDDLLAEWDALIDTANPMSKGTPWLDFNWISGQTDAAGVLYIGNIRLGDEAPEQPDVPVVPEIEEVTITETQRYETSVTTNINLLALYTANGGTSNLSTFTLIATFTPAEGEAITVNDPASVLVADIGIGTYVVTMETSDGVLVLTVTIKIYTETQTEIEVDEITISETILVEVTETSALNLTEMYVNNGGTTSIDALNEIGLIAKISSVYGSTTLDNVTEVDVTSLEKGVYTVELKTATGILVMTATVDVYAAADGLVWQSINENSTAYARVWKYGYLNVGETSYATVDGVKVLQFTTVKAGEANANQIGLRLLALHSKAYYTLMAETYESITFDVYVTNGGLNIKTCEDSATNGAWQNNNTWKTYTVSLAYLLEHWDTLNDLTSSNDIGASVTQLITTFWGEDNTHVVSIGNFGAVAKETSEQPDDGGSEETSIVWNDLSSTDAIKTTANRWNHTIPSIATASEIAAIGGESGAAYLRVDGGGEYFTYAAYKILPSGEKSAYEAYADYNVVFDWYFDIPEYDGGLNVQTYGETASTLRAQDTWYTVTISMADLLAEWDDLIDTTDPMSKGTPWLDFNWTSNSANKDAVLYIGNIRIEKAE